MHNSTYGRKTALAALAASVLLPGVALAEMRSSVNLYGVTGLVEMPTAGMQPDGELGVTVSRFGPNTRTTLSFQIAPRLSGSYRYIGIKGLGIGGFGPNDTYFDRSFDLRFRLIDEGRYMPAVAIGLQDFVGTGQFSAEYLVATKHVLPNVRVTGGLGWGRLASHRQLSSGLGTRPAPSTATGGTVNAKQWFRGPVSAFGGLEWHPTDRLGLKMEYSSDAYTLEETQGVFRRKSQVNFGAEYQVSDALRVGAYYLYGSKVGIGVHYALNPRARGVPAQGGPAPAPVTLRPDRQANPGAWGAGWTADAAARPALRDRLVAALRPEGIRVDALTVDATRAEVRIVNTRYDAPAQAVGRTARALSATMPASVEVFEIVPVVNGMAASVVRLRRSDIEDLENAPGNAAALRSRADFAEAGPLSPDALRGGGHYPRATWSIAPYLRLGLFDPSNPVRGDFGLRFAGTYELAPGLILSGAVTKKAVGNLNRSTRVSNSVLPRVRSETNIYDRLDPALEHLTANWYARPAPNLYSRVSVGYLERLFAGVSTELLWKEVGNPLAIGVELNHVRQRSAQSRLGLGNYKVFTGHVSAYYAFGNGFHGQLDVGRYLAGDVGATLSLDREFANGWRVGAFATLTNTSFADFGEGSFDKGIRLTVPLSFILGTPSRVSNTTTIRPVQRDGGARLEVDGRLYESIRSYHGGALDAQWGKVWR